MKESRSATPVTMKDVARTLGLTQSTVSKALRNSPEIPANTRERVHAAAAKLGYQPNAAAIMLAHFKRDSRSVPIQAGLAWLNCWTEPKQLRQFAEFDRYWQGACASAEKHGYRLEEFLCNDENTPARVEKVLLARGIKGILIPPVGRARMEWGGFRWNRFSIAMLAKLESPACHLIAPDQLWNAILAFDTIREKGYQRVGFVGDNWRQYAFAPGCMWAQLTAEPAAPRIEPLIIPRHDIARHRRELKPWIRKNRPDAILTDQPALPDILAEIGYRVPDDIGLAAMTVLDCPIDAGIYQNAEEIGRVGVLALISFISDYDFGIPKIPREVLVKGKWQDGKTLPNRK